MHSSCLLRHNFTLLYLNSGSASGARGSTVAALDCAATPEGGDLHGSVAQEDDEQQVEGSAEKSAHKVGCHTPVRLNTTPVVAVEGVRLAKEEDGGDGQESDYGDASDLMVAHGHSVEDTDEGDELEDHDPPLERVGV